MSILRIPGRREGQHLPASKDNQMLLPLYFEVFRDSSAVFAMLLLLYGFSLPAMLSCAYSGFMAVGSSDYYALLLVSVAFSELAIVALLNAICVRRSLKCSGRMIAAGAVLKCSAPLRIMVIVSLVLTVPASLFSFRSLSGCPYFPIALLLFSAILSVALVCGSSPKGCDGRRGGERKDFFGFVNVLAWSVCVAVMIAVAFYACFSLFLPNCLYLTIFFLVAALMSIVLSSVYAGLVAGDAGEQV